MVIYLKPVNNIGTNLFECTSKEGWKISKKLRGPFEVEWKENRALIFSPRQGFTPHSYKSNEIDHRHTLSFNLCTTADHKNIKESETVADPIQIFNVPT